MLKKNISWVAVAGLVVLLASCAKEGPNGPTGPAGPLLAGTIGGHVELYDMYGSAVTNGLTSVRLYLNASTIADSPDVSGGYNYTTLNDVALETGYYSITATDSAYASTIKTNLQLLTGALNVDVKMSAIPDSFVYGFHAYHNSGSAGDSLVLAFKPDARQRNYIIFANSIATVGGQPSTYLYSKVLSISPSATVAAYVVPAQDLTNLGFASGSKVYFAAYSYVVGDASVYEDITTGKAVYNAVSGGIVDSTYVP